MEVSGHLQGKAALVLGQLSLVLKQRLGGSQSWPKCCGKECDLWLL